VVEDKRVNADVVFEFLDVVVERQSVRAVRELAAGCRWPG
jgi:hypothetical protein